MRKLRRNEEGNAPIEAAIIFPIMLLTIMTVIQAGVYYRAREAARTAANGAALAAAVEDGTAEQAVTKAQARIDAAGGSSLLQDTRVWAERDDETLTVHVTGHAMTFVPGLPDLGVDVTVAAPVERFRP